MRREVTYIASGLLAFSIGLMAAQSCGAFESNNNQPTPSPTRTFEPRTFAPFPTITPTETAKNSDEFESIFHNFRIKNKDWQVNLPERKDAPITFTKVDDREIVDLSIETKDYPYTTETFADSLARMEAADISKKSSFKVRVGENKSDSFVKTGRQGEEIDTLVIVLNSKAFTFRIQGNPDELKKLSPEIQDILDSFDPFVIKSSR